MAEPGKRADGIRRLLLTIVLLALAGAVLLGLGALVRELVDHPMTSLRIIGIVVVAAFVLAAVAARLARRLPATTVIELDLATLPSETPDTSLASLLAPKKPTMREAIDALGRAAADKRVAGVLVHATFSSAGMAQVQELRDALAAVRAAGKFIVTYSDAYGNTSYYLATVADEVLLQPGGEVALLGLAITPNFIKGALDKLGVDVQAEGRWEYKSAADQATRTRMSRPFREMNQRLIDSLFGQIVAGVALRTGRSEKDVRALIDRGPFLANEALDEGLVDALHYRDQAIERAKELAGKKAVLLGLGGYRRRSRRAGKGRPAMIAVVTATGGIISRKSDGANPISGRHPMEADKVSEAIRKAVKDKRVKAIVLRVDSPGGSAIASETIWRETAVAKEKKKPIVVSMGNVAASGGYYIATAADRIVAHPGTITGSIGVISGKPVLAKAKRKVGIHAEELKSSTNAAMNSVNRPFNATELERFKGMLDDVYDTFTTRVMEGRGLTAAQVDKVARGRVWTGEDALGLGLVDELGGFATAIKLAKQVAGVKPDAPVKLLPFPKKQSALSQLREPRRSGSDDISALLGMLRGVLDRSHVLERGAFHSGLADDDWQFR